MSNSSTNSPEQHTASTPARILEVATQLFAENGFEKTTVRQISEAAGVNVAAVNYHFSDKEALYAEVLSRAHQCATSLHPARVAFEAGHPEEALREFVGILIKRIFDREHNQVFGRLMAFEMMQPTRALERLVEQEFLPTMKALSRIIVGVLGIDPGPAVLRRLCYSIVGQIVFYKHAGPLLSRMNPTLEYDDKEITELANHITRFSIAALRGYQIPREQDQ
ncbi:DUF1956 domain-containing protein [bacterium]|nr:DUF1956 domain-containing protein [bacterium]